LFSHDTTETITDTLVPFVGSNRLAGVLHLQEELNSLDGGDGGLGDSRRNTSDKEVGGEGSLLLLGSAHFSYCFFV